MKEIALGIAKHVEDNPQHGFNCACLEVYIQAMRAYLKENYPRPQHYDRTSQSLHYVLRVGSGL
jgi:hypothetical protein